METHTLNKNTLQKNVQACPMPPFQRLQHRDTYSFPKQRWNREYHFPLYILVSGVAGLIFLYTALFIPPIVSIEEVPQGSGNITILTGFSIFWTPIPFFVAIAIGLAANALVPLIEYHSFRSRLSSALVFALIFSQGFFIYMINHSLIVDTVRELYGLPSYTLPWLTSPWLFLLIATTTIGSVSLGTTILCLLSGYIGEYLWTSIKGPLHIDPSTRRTSVYIKGGERGTVLSVNHKGGYTRGFTRPSKWQAYDRED